MLAAGTGSAQLLVILAQPILTRLYTPTDYGHFAVAASLLVIIATVACLRYDFAIPLPDSDIAAANVVLLCLVIAISVASATLLILWMFGSSLLTVAPPLIGTYIGLLAAGVLVSGVTSAFTGWALRRKSYSTIAGSRLTSSGALVASQVSLGLLHWGAYGLLTGTVVGVIAGSFRFLWLAWQRDSDIFKRVSRPGLVAAMKRYRRFAVLSSPSAVLNTFNAQVPLLLIVALYGPDTGGQFFLAQRLITAPAFLVAGSIGQAFFAEAARLSREHPAGIRPLFNRATRTLSLVGIPPMLIVAVVSPFAFGVLFGPEWRDAGLYAAVLAPMNYFLMVFGTTGGILDVVERQDLHLAREVLRVVLMGGAVVVAAALHLPPLSAVGAVSIAGSLTYFLYGAVSWRAIGTHWSRAGSAGKALDG